MSKYPGRIVTDLAPAGYSVFFDGTDDYLAIADNVNLRPGAGAFTLEAWIYRAAAGAAHTIYAKGGASTGIVFQVTATNVLRFTHTTTNIDSTGTIAATTWTHVAVVREGTGTNQTKLYINGVQDGQGTVSTDFTQTEEVRIGTNRGATEDFSGNISNLIFVKGTAVYTAAFTPPTQLFNIPNTSLLTCNSPAIIDQSNNAFAITVNGNAAVSTLTPFTAYVPYNPALGASTPGVWTVDEALQAKGTRQWNMYDPRFNLTTLLLHGNGTNTAQNNTFLDSSSNNFTITRNPASGPNAPTQGTFTPFSQSPGRWSNYFDGSGDYLVTPSNSAFDPSGQNITVDFWVYLTRYATTTGAVFEVGSAAVGDMQCLIGNTGYVAFQIGGTAGSSVNGFTLNTWHYVTCVKSGTNFTAYLNGVAGTTVSMSPNSKTTLTIGAQGNGANAIDGYISNFRYVRGSANIPTSIPNAPLTNITNTSLLTCQSNRFVDNGTANSGSGFALTVNGNPSIQPFSPFYPTAAYTPSTIGGSGYFDGSGDYLTAAGDAAFAFGTGDFTVASWLYPTAAQVITIFSSNYNFSSGTGNWSLYFSVGAAASLFFNSGSGNKQSTVTTTIPLNSWTHVAYTRVGTTGRFFVNGAQLGGTISDSFNYGGGTGSLFVGRQSDGTGQMIGYMSGMQLLKGTGYSTLPIPTTPTTNITNTSLLLNFTNAGIVDSTAKNVLETVGNAQISTTQSKFGGSSMSFDGTGDYLQIPSSNLLAFGSSPYTVELWLYPNNVANLQGLFTMGAFRFFQNATGLWFLNSSTSIINVATGLSTGQWFHIALVREGTGTSQTKLYLNGSSIGTGTDANTWAAAIAYVGSEGASNQLNGYIDDLRITRFARYTGNFTPQTSQWQDE